MDRRSTIEKDNVVVEYSNHFYISKKLRLPTLVGDVCVTLYSALCILSRTKTHPMTVTLRCSFITGGPPPGMSIFPPAAPSPPGWIKFVKQLRVPAAPFASIPTALDFPTRKRRRCGKEDRGNHSLLLLLMGWRAGKERSSLLCGPLPLAHACGELSQQGYRLMRPRPKESKKRPRRRRARTRARRVSRFGTAEAQRT